MSFNVNIMYNFCVWYVVISVACVSCCWCFNVDFLDESFLEELDDLARTERNRREAQVPHLQDFAGNIQHEWNSTSHHIHNPSPTYIVNLYQSLTTGVNLLHPSQPESVAIQASDTVRSFGANVTVKNVSSDGTAAQFLATFKLSSFLENPEDLRMAELRVLIHPSRRRDTMEIGVNHFIRAPCKKDGDVFGCLIKKVLASRPQFDRHHDDFQDREVFDVTEVLREWMAEGADWDTNFELRTRHEYDSGEYEQEEIKSGADIFSEVVLVCFSKAASPGSIHLDAEASVKVRQRRSTDRQEEKRKNKKEKELRKTNREEQEQRKNDKLERERQRGQDEDIESGPCRRVRMHVDFYEVGWAHWIIYPKEFNAYRCAGRCNGYLDSHYNPSNHAILQGLVRIRNRDRAPEPCCVPTKLSPLSILYFEEGTIVMKHHEDMMVEECGCR